MRPAEPRPRMGPPVSIRFPEDHSTSQYPTSQICILTDTKLLPVYSKLHSWPGKSELWTHLSETALLSLHLHGHVLEGLLWSSCAFLLCLQQLLHASERRQAGPAVPGCCSYPDAASGSAGLHTDHSCDKSDVMVGSDQVIVKVLPYSDESVVHYSTTNIK